MHARRLERFGNVNFVYAKETTAGETGIAGVLQESSFYRCGMPVKNFD